MGKSELLRQQQPTRRYKKLNQKGIYSKDLLTLVKPLINFRILQMSDRNGNGKLREWRDYRKSINKLL